jgi:hypothetical protein
MIPTKNKIIQLSPYGLEQAITILLTLNLTIYHKCCIFFVDASFEKKLAFTTTTLAEDLKGRISSKFAYQFIF